MNTRALAQTGGLLLMWFAIDVAGANAQVTADRLVNAGREPQNWLMYSGDYAGRRYSALEQVNATTAGTLAPK